MRFTFNFTEVIYDSAFVKFKNYIKKKKLCR